MSTTEMKAIIKSKVDKLPDDQMEKVFARIIETIDMAAGGKIELEKHVPAIFNKYDELLKKLA